MLFNKEDIEAMCFGDCYTGFEIIEKGDWISEGNFEYKEVVFKFENKFYTVIFSRSGSAFTDWYYYSEDWDNEIDCIEVEPVEIITTVYKVKPLSTS